MQIEIKTMKRKLEPFDEWAERVMPYLIHVQKILAEPLSENPVTVYTQLCRIEAEIGTLNWHLADASSYIEYAKQREVTNKPGWRALDREIHLDFSVSLEKRFYKKIDGLVKAAMNRCILGCNLRNTSKGERLGINT